MKLLFSCIVWTNVYLASSTVLESQYFVDTTLTVANSPYFVVNDVTIRDGVTLTIDNGVEIWYNNSQYAKFLVRGSIIAGCNSIDTLNVHSRGLVDNKTYTYIHGPFDEHFTGIEIDDNANQDFHLEFCNVVFEGFRSEYKEFFVGSSSSKYKSLSFDNCEFKANIGIVSEALSQQFTDCIFHPGTELKCNNGDCLIDNCLFNESDITFYRAQNAFVSNTNTYQQEISFSDTANCSAQNVTMINGDGITIDNGYMHVSYSTFINCSQAISILDSHLDVFYNQIINGTTGIVLSNYYRVHIKYNNITNNTYGIGYFADSRRVTDIRYNNFIYNYYAIVNGVDLDVNMDYNYFEVMIVNITNVTNITNITHPHINIDYITNISDPAFLASTILDVCDGYVNGLVTFWPWLFGPVYIGVDAEYDERCTFDFVGCSFDDSSSYCYLPTTPTPSPLSRSSTSKPTRFSTSDNTKQTEVTSEIIDTTKSGSVSTSTSIITSQLSRSTPSSHGTTIVIVIGIIALFIIIIIVGVVYGRRKALQRQVEGNISVNVKDNNNDKYEAFVHPQDMNVVHVEGIDDMTDTNTVQ